MSREVGNGKDQLGRGGHAEDIEKLKQFGIVSEKMNEKCFPICSFVGMGLGTKYLKEFHTQREPEGVEACLVAQSMGEQMDI